MFRYIFEFDKIFRLTVKWPDFSLYSKIALPNPIPEFLKTKRRIQKRNALNEIKKFLELVLTNEIPLVVTAGLTACTSKCKGNRPLQVSIQASVPSYQGVFSGLGLKKSFQIPIQLTSPAYSLCLPFFFNVCPANSFKEIQKEIVKNCSACKNGKFNHTCINLVK